MDRGRTTLDKKYTQHGKDNMTLTLNKETNKIEDWHDDWKGTAIINNEPYYLNVKIRNDTWMIGTLEKKPPRQEEPKEEIKEEQTDTVHEDLDDEIPF